MELMEPAPTTTATPPVKPGHSPLVAWSALGVVYVVWGSTYLGLRVAVETLPPFAMVGVRFVLAGTLIAGWLALRDRLRGGPPTHTRHTGASDIGAGDDGDVSATTRRAGSRTAWRVAAISGGLLVTANGLVAWAEEVVPSGVAALVVATVPLFITLIDAVLARRWPGARVAAGLGLGLSGVALLVLPGDGGGALPVGRLLVLVLAALLWAAGSVYAGRAAPSERPLAGIAKQMLAGGAMLCAIAVLTGDAARFDPSAVSTASALALVYLVLVGSLLGFSAYVWTLRALRLDVAATYAFVNPVVAVLLGWVILDERLTAITIVAGAVVVAGVALIVSSHGAATTGRSPRRRPPRRAERLGAGAG